MNKYQPNLNDPRVVRKVTKAIAFANGILSDNKPRQWSTRYIDKYFGQQQNLLSKWLRSKLLICTNDRYAKDSGVCKEYIKNTKGINELVSLLNQSNSYPSVLQVKTKTISVSQVTTQVISETYKQELQTKKFVYEDKSNRLWHDLQRVKKEYKQTIFSQHGLKHQYDIDCCAPTLVLQYSQQLPEIIHEGKYIMGPMDLWLFALNEYLCNKTEVRQKLADEAEISYEQAKTIINALLMGAQLGHNKDTDIYKILDGDKARIEFLKEYQFIKELRSDIKTCWDYIKPTLTRREITTKTGKKRVLPISSRQKSGLYFDLERKVLNVIRHYLDGSNNKYFLEHDGFVCMKEVNTEELSKWVKFNTGFNINLQHMVLPVRDI